VEWIKVQIAAEYSATSKKTIYDAIKQGKLRAARIGAGRNLVTCRTWVDAWLTACAK